MRYCGCALGMMAAIAATGMLAHAGGAGTQPGDTAAKEVAVEFVGGFETQGVDKGRPVILVAAALGVPAETFRKAFSAVKPAAGGREPEPAQVRKNKAALMAVLEPLGVTNDRLDEVSNYYRYNRGKGETWKHETAEATATVKDGVVTGITLIKPGAGYSSAPKVVVPGVEDAKVTVSVLYTKDLKTNGSIKSLSVDGK